MLRCLSPRAGRAEITMVRRKVREGRGKMNLDDTKKEES